MLEFDTESVTDGRGGGVGGGGQGGQGGQGETGIPIARELAHTHPPRIIDTRNLAIGHLTCWTCKHSIYDMDMGYICAHTHARIKQYTWCDEWERG